MVDEVQAARTKAWTYPGLVWWFLGGLVASTVLIVVIPPLDLVLLLGLLVATVVRFAYHRRRDSSLVAMFLGVVAFSLYALIWVVMVGN